MSISTLRPKFKLNQTYREFTFTKVLPLEELNIILYELQHIPTGATVLHLEADDPENLFCFSFPTFPTDSTGVAHILEHTVLCGSNKFPIKDPFFSMGRRSLNTFMNAMTGADFTCYPAASQIEKDFYNLMEVYLDAIFFPELKELSFLQEGHRLEFENSIDSTTPLVFKGVVFNEMKGALSAPESRLWQEIMTALTPDLPYAFNSGGDPQEIPHLTYEQLKDFHATYYHPSHCLFFFYGNLPLTKHLDCITQHVLGTTSRATPLPPICKQTRTLKPRYVTKTYPTQDDASRDFVTLSWLTTTPDNQQDVLALAILDSILMDTDASPLKMALLKSGLCTQADGYLDIESSEIPYTIICRGCKSAATQHIESLIVQTLKQISEEGIPQQLIEAAYHQIEFSRLEIKGDYGPFGLTLFFRAGLAMHHGCEPENALTVHSLFDTLLTLTQNPSYFPELIQRYFLNNSHRVTLTFKPDIQLEKLEEDTEKSRLHQIQRALTQEDTKRILRQTQDLKKYQDAIECQSLDCLPTIKLSDVPKNAAVFKLNTYQHNTLTTFHHECFTNHILFASLIFDLPYIPYEDLSYLQLLVSLLPEIGAGERNYQNNLEYIQSYLGGFSASLNLYPQSTDPNLLKPCIRFKGKALKRNTDKLFTLFKDTCCHPRLNQPERIKELILQIATALENRLNRNAMSYAIQLSVAPFNQSPYIGQYWSGIRYFQFIRSLAHNIDQQLPAIIDKLQQLQSTVLHLSNPHLVLSCDTNQYATLENAQYYGLGDLPASPFTSWENHPIPSTPPEQAYSIASPVAFSALGIPTAPLLSPAAPALNLSTELIDNTYLHKKVREQGGAYGSGASYNPMTGSYYLYSYRDPHIQATYQAFYASIQAIAAGKFSDRELTEAKLGIIQDLDAPVAPGSRAMTAYHDLRGGYTAQLQQNYRNTLLAMTKKTVQRSVEHLLLNNLDRAKKITFTSASHLEKEGSSLPITSL